MQRHDARELLLTALYRCEFLPAALEELFEETDPEDQRGYMETVFNGIRARQPEIDKLLALLDRNILRLGVYELLYLDEVPPEVALNEAVELAKKFGTEKARQFINGILDRIWKEHRDGTAS
jgi:transcription antitermination factor NusB